MQQVSLLVEVLSSQSSGKNQKKTHSKLKNSNSENNLRNIESSRVSKSAEKREGSITQSNFGNGQKLGLRFSELLEQINGEFKDFKVLAQGDNGQNLLTENKVTDKAIRDATKTAHGVTNQTNRKKHTTSGVSESGEKTNLNKDSSNENVVNITTVNAAGNDLSVPWVVMGSMESTTLNLSSTLGNKSAVITSNTKEAKISKQTRQTKQAQTRPSNTSVEGSKNEKQNQSSQLSRTTISVETKNVETKVTETKITESKITETFKNATEVKFVKANADTQHTLNSNRANHTAQIVKTEVVRVNDGTKANGQNQALTDIIALKTQIVSQTDAGDFKKAPQVTGNRSLNQTLNHTQEVKTVSGNLITDNQSPQTNNQIGQKIINATIKTAGKAKATNNLTITKLGNSPSEQGEIQNQDGKANITAIENTNAGKLIITEKINTVKPTQGNKSAVMSNNIEEAKTSKQTKQNAQNIAVVRAVEKDVIRVKDGTTSIKAGEKAYLVINNSATTKTGISASELGEIQNSDGKTNITAEKIHNTGKTAIDLKIEKTVLGKDEAGAKTTENVIANRIAKSVEILSVKDTAKVINSVNAANAITDITKTATARIEVSNHITTPQNAIAEKTITTKKTNAGVPIQGNKAIITRNNEETKTSKQTKQNGQNNTAVERAKNEKQNQSSQLSRTTQLAEIKNVETKTAETKLTESKITETFKNATEVKFIKANADNYQASHRANHTVQFTETETTRVSTEVKTDTGQNQAQIVANALKDAHTVAKQTIFTPIFSKEVKTENGKISNIDNLANAKPGSKKEQQAVNTADLNASEKSNINLLNRRALEPFNKLIKKSNVKHEEPKSGAEKLELTDTTTLNKSQAAVIRQLAASAMPNSTTEQIIQKIKVMLAQNKPSSLEVLLKPEYLGRVKIHLQSYEGLISVRIITDSGETANLLNAGLQRFREDLNQQGIKLQHIEVDVGSQNKEGQAGQDGQYASNYGQDSRNRNTYTLNSTLIHQGPAEDFSDELSEPATTGLSYGLDLLA